jgi:hypothetical protein
LRIVQLTIGDCGLRGFGDQSSIFNCTNPQSSIANSRISNLQSPIAKSAIGNCQSAIEHYLRKPSVNPPSTGMTCPVVFALCSPASQQMALAQSMGRIGRRVIVRRA